MNAPEPLRVMQADAQQNAPRAKTGGLSLLMRWHWISSALSLVGMLFFALSGLTLSRADYFERADFVVIRHSGMLPAPLLAELKQLPPGADRPPAALPPDLPRWLRQAWSLSIHPKALEVRSDEIFIDLKSPGVDAWLRIDRQSGAIEYESDDRGWVAYFNDLHKGKNAGSVWTAFLNLFSLACVVFCLTGLLILKAHARSRWITWPITGLGLLVPLLLILLFVH